MVGDKSSSVSFREAKRREIPEATQYLERESQKRGILSILEMELSRATSQGFPAEFILSKTEGLEMTRSWQEASFGSKSEMLR